MKVKAGINKSVYLPKELVDKVAALAVELDRSWSDTVKILLTEAMSSLEKIRK